MTQQIHSFRASGVRFLQAACVFASEQSAMQFEESIRHLHAGRAMGSRAPGARVGDHDFDGARGPDAALFAECDRERDRGGVPGERPARRSG